MLVIKDLYKKIGNKVLLDNVNMQVNKNSIVAIVGPNGSSKTTLMKAIMGLVKVDSGSIMFNEKEMIKSLDMMSKEISFLPSVNHLQQSLSVTDHINLFKKVNKIKDDYVNKLIEMLNMKDYLSKKVAYLSVGMKQALLVALSFTHKGSIVIIDEPMSGLDPIRRRYFIEFLKKESKKRTILFSSYVLNEVFKVADKIYFSKEGKIIYGDYILKNEVDRYKVICSTNKKDKGKFLSKKDLDLMKNYIVLEKQNIEKELEEKFNFFYLGDDDEIINS